MTEPPRDYEEWKSRQTADVRASSWLGLVVGGLAVSVIYALPVYLLIAAFADSLSVVPNTKDELVVLGIIVAVAAVPYLTRLFRGESRLGEP